MKQNDNLLEYQKRFQQIMEYVVSTGTVLGEEGNDNQQDAPADDSSMGGDPNAMGGDMGMSDPNAMGGDPNAMGGATDPSMGGDPNAMGGAADPSIGGAEQGGQMPQGFNPQDMSADPSMGGDPNAMDGTEQGDTMQPDDEVIDISDLTDAQEDMSDDIKNVTNKFDKLFKTLGSLGAMLKANDEKINALTDEFEKRNPTNVEKLGMQASKSYPFNVKPEDYWRDKTENSNYSLEDDNNGKGDENYAITNADVNDNNWRDIIKSFDDEDSFMYNQTLNNLLHIK